MAVMPYLEALNKYMISPLYLVSQVGFLALTFIFLVLALRELKKALSLTRFTDEKQKRIYNRTSLSWVAWFIFMMIWSLSGIMSNFSLFPLNMLPVFGIPLITIVIVLFSKTTKEIVRHIPQQTIIILQSFRLFVELLLWLLFLQNLVPEQMTFAGYNLDILSGISAIVVAYLARHKKLPTAALVVWNLFCLGLLINIVVIAMLSMPVSFRLFMNEPANTIIAIFPFCLLPSFLVPLAYGLHFLSLLKTRKHATL